MANNFICTYGMPRTHNKNIKEMFMKRRYRCMVHILIYFAPNKLCYEPRIIVDSLYKILFRNMFATQTYFVRQIINNICMCV